MNRVCGSFFVVLGVVFAACSSDDDSDAAANGGGGAVTPAGGSDAKAGTPGATGGRSGSASGGRAASGGASNVTGGAPSGASGAGAGGGGGNVPPAAVPRPCENLEYDDRDFETVIEVGPGFGAETPSDVPWESLTPGTLVRIHPRAEPYRDKWVVNARGTKDAPIVVVGVSKDGVLPAISGEGATTRPELDYWNEERGIVKIGGASVGEGAAYVTLSCLDIGAGRAGLEFRDASGATSEYAENAACVYLEEGEHISIRNNVLHGCSNGLFASSGSSDVLVSGNDVYDNGNVGSAYEHNSYTECSRITFEFNRYGALCNGCLGNNLKDRSAGLTVRYNWIEGGNRQLDLVDSGHDELLGDPAYRETFVYGNVLIEPDGAGNSQITHYGGDSGEPERYRKGTLYFFHNTVVSKRMGSTTLFRLSSEDETVIAYDNVFSASAAPSSLAITGGMGALTLTGNWLPQGFSDTHDVLTGSLDDGGNVLGSTPGFTDPEAGGYTLGADSDCVDAAASLPARARENWSALEYVKHQRGRARADDGSPDIGAFERQ